MIYSQWTSAPLKRADKTEPETVLEVV